MFYLLEPTKFYSIPGCVILSNLIVIWQLKNNTYGDEKMRTQERENKVSEWQKEGVIVWRGDDVCEQIWERGREEGLEREAEKVAEGAENSFWLFKHCWEEIRNREMLNNYLPRTPILTHYYIFFVIYSLLYSQHAEKQKYGKPNFVSSDGVKLHNLPPSEKVFHAGHAGFQPACLHSIEIVGACNWKLKPSTTEKMSTAGERFGL